MATVRFSKDLIGRISGAARLKMQPAIQRACDQKPGDSWGQRIYDILFGDVKAIAGQLPNGWVKTIGSLRIVSVAGKDCGITFTFSPAVPWPYQFSDNELAYGYPRGYNDGGAIALSAHPVWNEFAAEVAAYRERVNAAVARRDEFVKMVDKVCNAYSTLAPALKAWPPLWDLLPEDVKAKHQETTVREKTTVVLDVDLDKLTALSTAAKLGV